MVIFHSYVNVYQRVEHVENWHTVNHSDLCGDGCCFYMLLPLGPPVVSVGLHLPI